MKISAIFSVLSISALAAAVAIPEPEANVDAHAAADGLLEKRADCSRILPICAAAVRIQRDSCPCSRQKPICSLYACQGGRRVSVFISSCFLSLSLSLCKAFSAVYNSVSFNFSNSITDFSLMYSKSVAHKAAVARSFERQQLQNLSWHSNFESTKISKIHWRRRAFVILFLFLFLLEEGGRMWEISGWNLQKVKCHSQWVEYWFLSSSTDVRTPFRQVCTR